MNIEGIVYSLVDVGHILQEKATSQRLLRVSKEQKKKLYIGKKIEETHRLRMIEVLLIDSIQTETIRIKDKEMLN